MRGRGGKAVRTAMAETAHPRRRWEERVGLWFPGLVERLGRLLWRLGPESRLRRAIERRFLRYAWEAFNRDDLDAAFLLYHPDCECHWDPKFPTVGLESTIRGKEERMRAQRRVQGDWQELRFIPEETIQFDDRLVSVGRMKGRGLTSGAEVEVDWVVELTLRDGRAIRERIAVDREEGLAAAGIPN